MSFFSQSKKDVEKREGEQQWALLSEHLVDPSIVESNKDKNAQLLTFKVDSYRFFNVAVFVISALGNNLIVHTTSPITKQLKNIFPDYSPTVISLCSLVFYILHPPMAFVSNYIIETKGLKYGITLGAATMIVGTGIRCLVKEGFFFVIIGQVINALGNCFITNSPSKVAANWFQPKDRPAVTAISTFSVLASGALGLVIPSIFVSETKNEVSDVFNLMVVEFIIIVVIMTFNIVCFRGAPPSAPSYAANIKEKVPFSRMLMTLFSNKNYLLLLAFITLLLGTINAYIATMDLLMSPFGYKSIDVSLIGVFSIAFGFFGSIVGAIILKKTRKYQPIMNVGTLLATACMFLELVCLVQESDSFKIGAYIMSGFAGFFVYPVFSTALEFGCEIAYPAGEASVAGYLLAGSQIFGFVLGLIMASILDGDSQSRSYVGGTIFLVLVFVSVIPLGFTKQDLRRSRKEVQGTLNENAILDKQLEEEIKVKYVVDKEATNTIIEQETKKRTIINNNN